MNTLFTRDEHGNLRLYDFSVGGEFDLSIRELADLAVARGELGTFDFALPITWCDDVRDKLGGESPFGFVWSYPAKSIWGEPFPLSVVAASLLKRYNEVISRG